MVPRGQGAMVRRNGVNPDSGPGRVLRHLLGLPDGTRVLRRDLSRIAGYKDGNKVNLQYCIEAGLLSSEAISERRMEVWIADRKACEEALRKRGVADKTRERWSRGKAAIAYIEALRALAGERVTAMAYMHRRWPTSAPRRRHVMADDCEVS